MEVNVKVGISDWSPEDEDFQSHMKRLVVRELARQLKDVHIHEAMKEIVERSVVEAELLIKSAITSALSEGVEINEGDDPVSMQDMIKDKLREWRLSKGDAHNAWNRNNNIDSLQSIMIRIIQTELNSETESMLREVKDSAIKQARKTISDNLANKIFDGKDLLRIG